MLSNFRLTYANVVSSIALFVVVSGGTAVAAGVAPNSVKSSSVANNSLTSADLKDGRGVIGADVKDDTLTGSDIDEKTLKLPAAPAPAPAPTPAPPPAQPQQEIPASLPPNGPAGGALTGTFPNPALATGAVDSAAVRDGSVTGTDIDENSLATVPAAALGGTGRAENGESCNPESTTPISCARVFLTLPRPGRVLIMGEVSGIADGSSAGGNVGACHLATSANGPLGPTEKSMRKEQTKSMFTVTTPISAGPVNVSLECSETSDIKYGAISLTAVALSGS